VNLYVVGQPYHPDRAEWPEAVTYNFRGGEHELLFFLHNPRRREIEDIEAGDSEFGVLTDQGVVFLLYRFGASFPWGDAPYNWHLNREEDRSQPIPASELLENNRALLHVLAVDGQTGILLAMRAVSLSPAVTQALHSGIQGQISAGPIPDYRARLDRIYAKYPQSSDMAERAVRCKGGD
jgi:hypothetical protein